MYNDICEKERKASLRKLKAEKEKITQDVQKGLKSNWFNKSIMSNLSKEVSNKDDKSVSDD